MLNHYIAHRAQGHRMVVYDDDCVGASELGHRTSEGRCATLTHPRLVLFVHGATRPSRSPPRSTSFPANGRGFAATTFSSTPVLPPQFSFIQSLEERPTLFRGMSKMLGGTEERFPQPALMESSSSRPADDDSQQQLSSGGNRSLISALPSASILFSSLLFFLLSSFEDTGIREQ